MKRAVLLLVVCLGASWAAPVEQEGPEEANCTDPAVLGAAGEAMDQVNKDRKEGYVFSLHTLVNAHTQKHDENSDVFYLTTNILETNCSVLSKKHYDNCEPRKFSDTPVYGQCKLVVIINRAHPRTLLQKYDCTVRRASAASVLSVCPDCPSHMNKDDEAIQRIVSKSLATFNKESGLSKLFALRKITRATASEVTDWKYNVEFTIQETTCPNRVDKPEDCPVMDCEFTHYGFCRVFDVSNLRLNPDEEQEHLSPNCEIYEPEAAVRGKDHSHNDTQATNPAYRHGHTHMHDYEQVPTMSTPPHDPMDIWIELPPLNGSVTPPAMTPSPGVGVTQPVTPGPQTPGQTKPTTGPFPTKQSVQCARVFDTSDLVSNLYTNDPEFN